MMNPEQPHNFVPIDKPKDATPGWPVFKVGEEFVHGGVRFRVRKITRRDIVLRPMRMEGSASD